MGAVGTLLRSARRARPAIAAIQRAEAAALAGGEVAVMAGEPDSSERLRELAGVPTAAPMPEGGLWLYAAVAGEAADRLERAARALARHRAGGRGALVILIGSRPQRVAMERVFLDAGLEPSNLAQVASLEGPGGRRALQAITMTLEDHATAAGRRYHALRPAVAHLLVARASRRAGLVGAINISSGADVATLALLHVQLLAELSALHERPLGAERAAEAAAVVGAGFGWRALARAGASALPSVPGAAIRGGVAYAATRALGEAAVARLEAGGEVLGERPAELIRGRLGGVAAKLGLGEGS